jgi:hypothetical protein
MKNEKSKEQRETRSSAGDKEMGHVYEANKIHQHLMDKDLLELSVGRIAIMFRWSIPKVYNIVKVFLEQHDDWILTRGKLLFVGKPIKRDIDIDKDIELTDHEKQLINTGSNINKYIDKEKLKKLAEEEEK